MEKQRMDSDLDIVVNIAMQINENEADVLHSELQSKYNSQFLREKQLEFHSILHQQDKRLKQLTSFIAQLERSSSTDRVLRELTCWSSYLSQ